MELAVLRPVLASTRAFAQANHHENPKHFHFRVFSPCSCLGFSRSSVTPPSSSHVSQTSTVASFILHGRACLEDKRLLTSGPTLATTPLRRKLRCTKADNDQQTAESSAEDEEESGNPEVAPPASGPSYSGSLPLEGENTRGLIFGQGGASAWDNGGVGGPVVRRYLSDNEERWCMWYHGGSIRSEDGVGSSPGVAGSPPLASSNLGSVGLALSRNGVHWSRGDTVVETDANGNGGAGLVLAPSSNWWAFDTRHVSVSDVLIMSSRKVRAQAGVYWLYYSGGDAEEMGVPGGVSRSGVREGSTVEGMRLRPGLAMSNDGRNWARIEGDHHSGALFDVGAPGEWDSLFVGAPHVVFHEAGDIRMYYYSMDEATGVFSLGFARSRDGLKWVKFGRIMAAGPPGSFDERGTAACHVINDPEASSDGGYLMFYEGVAKDGTRSIGLARSKDGLQGWERVGSGPVLTPANPGSWDSLGVGSPCVVEMQKGQFRLYYEGWGPQGTTGIGMAESTGGTICDAFERWQGLSEPL